ncbi:MAG: enoyl-CoA hydratase/isomerase family protein [Ilumatobacteraceae bacterium]
MSSEPLLVTKRDDGVAIISTNDDPLNRMSVAYIDLLDEVIDDIAADDAIRAFVLTAEGTTNFSVGMNLKELGSVMRERGVDAFFDQRVDLISRIETMGKPSVATLFGYCLGGGLELPLGCTFRLAAAEGASIGLPEMDLGTTPAWGGSARLAKCVGRNHALDMILRAKKITGPEALSIGLVTEVWPLAELKDRAIALAVELAAQPRLAVRAMLDALHDSEDKTLEELLAAERAGVHATRNTPDSAEGIAAFLEKRRPVFNRPPT